MGQCPACEPSSQTDFTLTVWFSIHNGPIYSGENLRLKVQLHHRACEQRRQVWVWSLWAEVCILLILHCWFSIKHIKFNLSFFLFLSSFFPFLPAFFLIFFFSNLCVGITHSHLDPKLFKWTKGTTGFLFLGKQICCGLEPLADAYRLIHLCNVNYYFTCIWGIW